MLLDIFQPKKGAVDPKTSQFTFCELFAGIGGFGVALEALGGTCVFASEISAPSIRTYCRNVKTLPKVSGDIWKIQNIPRHDLLVGGFPCQPFSSLGQQPGLEDDKTTTGRPTDENVVGGRGQLFTQIVRVLKECQPQAFLLENVPGLIHTDNGNALQTILSALEGAGYTVTTEVCSSRGLTAQSRKRFYLVGLRNRDKAEPFLFPFMPDLGLRVRDILHTEKELQTSFAVTGVPLETRIDTNDKELTIAAFRLTDTQMDQLRFRSKTWKPAKLAWDDTVCDTMDSHYGVTVGKGNSQLVPCSAPHHPRRFTPREAARLMGFRNSFLLCGPSSSSQGFHTFIKEQYHMLGNAVCPPVIAVLAGAILAQCPGIAKPTEHSDWVEAGLFSAIDLALEAVAPCRRIAVQQALHASFLS
jgi:DNA (cytosine-5)-methyltransferase 1